MELMIFEIGQDNIETRNQLISFDGTLEAYQRNTIKRIEADPSLVFHEVWNTNDGSVVIDYYSIPSKKMFRLYIFVPKMG